MPVDEIVKARKCGHVRFHAIFDYPFDRNRILIMCYLKPEAETLLEIGRDEAARVLVCWLHRDAAYESELMSPALASELAEKFLREFSDESSRFFTNGRWFDSERPQAWQSLTESVFDGGLLIESGIGNYSRHICIWFEDED
ncbi:MAG TPA: hypothetical protein VMF08_09265 [Candidatus Sulfotelmatobacter sp.]|nr:hypothetical protein [Candidatus Sulfotelmatobacter sp.]